MYNTTSSLSRRFDGAYRIGSPVGEKDEGYFLYTLQPILGVD